MKKILLCTLMLGILLSCAKRASMKLTNGYLDKESYSVGEEFKLYLNADIKGKEVKIYNLSGKPVARFKCKAEYQSINESLPYENGFGYEVTLKSTMPDLPSGVYLFDNSIPFVIKPSEKVDLLIVYSSNTENAYTASGGKSLYSYHSADKVAATKVSVLRPHDLPIHSTQFLRWMSYQSDFSVGYICDKDLDHYSNLELGKVLVIVGHSEYWTRQARYHFDHFIDQGNNALIMSGNSMWWQVRYDDEKNQMICYKNAQNDPTTDPLMKTILWNDPGLDYPIVNSIGLDFDKGGFGLKEDKGWDGFKIVAPTSKLLEGTNLKKGDVLRLPSDEYDGADLEFDSNGEVKLLNNYGFFKYELIGFDLASRKESSNGAWIVMQKFSGSGVIVNTSSTNWCAEQGMEGRDSDKIKLITLNCFRLLLQNDKSKLFVN